MKKYVIGIDYGTLSGRCLLVDASNGEERAESVLSYPHGVIDRQLPNGERLPPKYALQHPQDYLDVLRYCVPDVLKKAGASADDVIGIGIDFTACTILPINEKNIPLCMLEEHKGNKHAYVKLWKHHAAQEYADEITALASRRGESWLPIYGSKISCEWALPKILQVLREAPEIYNASYRFIEAADWISLMLTGNETHSAVFAGYKGLWNAETGYPSNDFMKALDCRLDGIVGTKLSTNVLGMDEIAGHIDENGARLVGLNVGTPVALPMIDAHAAMPALNITDDGELMIILGTSACHILNARTAKKIDGISGYVKDGVIPGLYTYEAGQAAVGDIFDWFVESCIPASYISEAQEKRINVHALLREKVRSLAVGEERLLALDWWNGNRSILGNSDLTGMILGLTLQTKPEHIYKALIEATAYGLKMIVEQYESNGIEIKSICAAGGISQKDDMMMQIYADVLEREIRIAGSAQAGALGSAIYAAVAAGFYPNIKEAAKKLSKPDIGGYQPIKKNTEAYRSLYNEYKRLHDYFGRENQVMERLAAKAEDR